MKILKLVLFFTTSLFICSCSDYKIENGKVYYKYWTEANGIMGSETRIDADPMTFQELEDGYAKDKKSVFYEGKLIVGADAKSFELLEGLFSKDSNRAFYAGEIIKNSTSKNFKVIDSYYSTDGVDIFYETEPLNVCSVKNFKFVDNDDSKDYLGRWTTDGCYYYFSNHRIPSNDYKNVILLEKSAGFAKDKKWVYYNGRVINYDENGKKILDTVDVESFIVTDHIINCKDKFGCINVFHGREKCD